jgi:exonuclease III
MIDVGSTLPNPSQVEFEMKAARNIQFFILATLLIFAGTGFSQLVDPRGSDLTIDIATWNLQLFPLNGATTTTIVGLMVGDLELDVIGVQEITDPSALSSAASTAGGWSSVTGPNEGGGYLGVLYDNSTVDVTAVPFTIPGNEFTRNPFVVPMIVTENETSLQFNLVSLHLKAFHNPSDIDRRRAEIAGLKAYIDNELLNGGEENWIIVGDYNDELDDPEQWNVFLPLLEDENYEFLTLPLAGDEYHASYPGYPSMIDHILVTSALLDEFGEDGEVETLRLDDEYPYYFTDVSDHRPVAAYFPTMELTVDEGNSFVLPTEITVNVWPVPSNATVTVGYSLPTMTGQMMVYDLLGRSVSEQMLSLNQGRVVWEAQSVPSGIYLIRVQDANGLSVQRRAVVLK